MLSFVRIDVVTVALANIPSQIWPRLAFILSEDERVRADRFQFERNRQEHVAAHALKRLMLSDAAGRLPQDWTFEKGREGKPIVADPGGPHFNLSHCDGLVACAVSRQVAVGVDVERTSRSVPLDIAESYFSQRERRWLSSRSSRTIRDGAAEDPRRARSPRRAAPSCPLDRWPIERDLTAARSPATRSPEPS